MPALGFPCLIPGAATQVIEAETRATTRWELSAEGEEVLRDGSPEVRLFHSVPSEGLPQSDAMVSAVMGRGKGGGAGGLREHSASPTALTALPFTPQKLPGAQVGFSKAMANKWLRLDKAAPGGPRIFRAVSALPPPPLLLPPSLPTGLWAPTHLGGLQVGAVQDVVQSSLRQVQEGNGDSLSERERTDLKRRKLLLEVCVGTGAELDFGEGWGNNQGHLFILFNPASSSALSNPTGSARAAPSARL